MTQPAVRWSKCLALISLSVLCAAHAFAGPQAVAHKSDSNGRRDGVLRLDANLTILESPDTRGPIQKAIEDLSTDFEKVLGKKPRIVNREEDAGAVTILVGEQSKIPEAMRPAGQTAAESFSISATTANWNKTRPAKVVLLSGADMRGTIYSIYEFSERFLGTDPLYYWTDHEPARRMFH